MAGGLGVNIGSTSADFSVFDPAATRFQATRVPSTVARPDSRAMTDIANLDTHHWITPSDTACCVHAAGADAHSPVPGTRVRRVTAATGHSGAVREAARPALQIVLALRKLSALAGGATRGAVDRCFCANHRILERLAHLSRHERPGITGRARGVPGTVVAECEVPAG